MKKEQDMVREFHVAFLHPVSDCPKMLSSDRVEGRAGWMTEEVNEFISAKTLDEQADAMVDLMYFALGTLVEMGVDGEKLFHIVHQANMTKLWPDGKPRFRAGDGKVQKPPTWVDPHKALKIELVKQIQKAKVNNNEQPVIRSI